MLSLPDLAAYLKDTSYVGQLVGRYGNRIAGAAFELDGKKYKLTANNAGNTLHGGEVGFGKYVWKVIWAAGADKNTYVKLGHRSPAGINGFPGNLDVTALYQRVREHAARFEYEATTDAPTPISLTWHPYFTLSGDPRDRIDEQRLTICRQPLSTRQRRARTHRRDRARCRHAVRFPQVENHARAAALLASADRAHPRLRSLLGARQACFITDGPVAAELYAPSSGVRMQVKTNLPGLQVYDASHFRTVYPEWHGICLEPENFPDAPNHANFPSSILRPGETHRSFMSFAFSV